MDALFLLFLSSGEWRLGKSEKGALAPAFVYALSLCIVVMDRDTESSKDNKCFFFCRIEIYFVFGILEQIY